MRERLIESIVNSLAKVIDIDSQKLIEKFFNMSDNEVIAELSIIVYKHFKNDEEMYTYFLEFINNINPEVSISVDHMKEELNKLFLNEKDSMSMEDNHKLVLGALEYFTKMFNQNNVDYYVIGSLPCFIKTGTPLFRYHDDINVMVNVDDLDKVSDILNGNGYLYSDDRFISLDRYYELTENPLPYCVGARSLNKDFHISIVPFRREQDNSITTLEYLHIPNNDGVRVDVIERTSTLYGNALQFDGNYTELGDSHFKSISLEYAYDLKCNSKKPKDISDAEKFEQFVDKEKLKELRRNTNKKNVIKDVQSDVMKL